MARSILVLFRIPMLQLLRSLTRSLVLVLLGAPAALAGITIDATYTFCRVGAQHDDTCVGGSPELTTFVELGTLQLLTNGTFVVNGTTYVTCLAGGSTTQPFGVSGIYSLTGAGDLTLDFDPSMPGVDVSELRISADGEVVLEKNAEPEEPALLVAVRQGSGMSNASASDGYAFAGIGHQFWTGGLVTRATWGALSLDGAGTAATVVNTQAVGPSGTTAPPPLVAAPYSVAADGSFSLAGTYQGAVTSDGRFGFGLDTSGPYAELVLFLRKGGSAPSPGALDGDWYVDNFGGEQSSSFSTSEPYDSRGVATIDSATDIFSFTGTEAWADLFGGGGGPDAGNGTLAVAGDGSLMLTDSSPSTMDGWLGGEEELALIVGLNAPLEVSLGILMRGTEPVGTPYCFGDGSGAACPCTNDNDGSQAGGHAGCANGTAGGGAALRGTGSASVGASDLTLVASGLVPGQPGLFFQGNNAVLSGSGAVFGDGLRCAGGSVVRLQVVAADAGGQSASTIPIATTAGVSSGDVRRYQLWYRDPLGSPCGAAFNLSNGLEVTWMP